MLQLVLATGLWAGLIGTVAGCSGSCQPNREQAEQAPPGAPEMPDDWQLQSDRVLPREELWETEGRLEGKIKAMRMTIYKAGEHRVQLNTIVALDGVEADKMFRILANKKPLWAYVRKGELLYEFVGPSAAADQIQRGHSTLKP